MNFVPPMAIAGALLGAITIPVTLIAISHGPWRIASMGIRYKLGVATGWGLWLAVAALSSPEGWDVLAGAMIMATATMIAFNVWGLLAWGFMLSMLMAIFRAERPLTRDDWIRQHSGGTIDVFARNRFSVLLNLGLAEVRADTAAIRPGKGSVMARLAVFAAAWYGVERRP